MPKYRGDRSTPRRRQLGFFLGGFARKKVPALIELLYRSQQSGWPDPSLVGRSQREDRSYSK